MSAPCYDDDLGVESEPGETLASLKTKKPSKSRSNTKKQPEEPRSSQRKEIEKASKFDVLPSKTIAMHRVRWNMNKGSEKWLCYGGAAGIVRCQEIVLSDIERKWAIKK